MIASQTISIAVPESAWNTGSQFGNSLISLHDFAQDALAIERRISKGVNLENERSRYSLCCSRLEASVKIPSMHYVSNESEFAKALSEGRLPAVNLGSGYTDKLATLLQASSPVNQSARLPASFHPPQLLLQHAQGFYRTAVECQLQNDVSIGLRLNFIHWAVNAKCGIVEIGDTYAWSYDKATEMKASSPIGEESVEPQSVFDLGESEDLDEALDNTGRSAYLILREQIMIAIERLRQGFSAEVNFSNQPHEIITEVLHEFINTPKSNAAAKPVYIHVVYTDGSQGRPFPLACIPDNEKGVEDLFADVSPLKAALLSMRHLALDRDVDMAWFRNREVSKARAFGETDEFCYQRTRQQLSETRADGPVVIHLYQTGLQPAVIGFYRAVVEEILERKNTLSPLKVIPFFFRKSGRYAKGKPWS